MEKRLALIFAILIISGAKAQAPVQTSAPSGANLSAFLPAPGEVAGWSPKDKPLLYRGEDLFVYIDGGAEIYHEYGFRQVLSQDYAGGEGRSVALEIFEMSDSSAAFGMYTFKSSGKGRPAGLGQDSQVEDYYLNFWKGPFLVTVTGFDDSPASLDGVRKISQAVDRKIKVTGTRPALASILPAEAAGLDLKYLKGALGLFNLSPELPRTAFRFNEAVVGGSENRRIFVFRWAQPAETVKRFQEIKAALAGSPSFRDVRSQPDGTLEAAGPKGMPLRLQAFDDCLILTLGNEAAASFSQILAQLKKNRETLNF